MQKTYFLLLFIFLSSTVLAQQSGIKIIQPKEIEDLIERHIALNSEIKRLPGWRIQIKSSSERNEVMQTKVDFLNQFPNVKTYMTYQQPYFKFRVGDFTDRGEAVKLMHDVNDAFKGIFIVPDIVNVLPEGVSADTKDNNEIKVVEPEKMPEAVKKVVIDSVKIKQRNKMIADSLRKKAAVKTPVVKKLPAEKKIATDTSKILKNKKTTTTTVGKKTIPSVSKTKTDSLKRIQAKKTATDSIHKKTLPKKPVTVADSISKAHHSTHKTTATKSKPTSTSIKK